MPAGLPAPTAAELSAAVQAALDNVRRHAGPGAHAWVLLEDEADLVRVTVRDNGIGFPPRRGWSRQPRRAGWASPVRGVGGRDVSTSWPPDRSTTGPAAGRYQIHGQDRVMRTSIRPSCGTRSVCTRRRASRR
ncbi:ATP-binding protein [Micromonospora olivasterospora]|uniref:ATP-binding protein n=1 Tax=Micromonospora olivasterospora TaxID=1880 RepID=UPI00319E68D6